MPASRPVRGIPRRDLLRLAGIAATGAALAACTTSPDQGSGPTASPGAPDDPDLVVRTEVASDEAALSDLYAESATAFPPALRAQVAALGARHADYRAAVLAGSASPTASSSPTSASASPSGSGSASASAALGRLRAAERNAAASRAEQSVRAQSPELARTIVLAGTGAAAAAERLRGLA